jgi:LuxR family maltose regulon positive regulatory protein
LTALRAEEVRLLGWVGRGMTNQAIARRLSVSVSTVERRLSSIYRTLGVNSRAQAVSLLAGLSR